MEKGGWIAGVVLVGTMACAQRQTTAETGVPFAAALDSLVGTVAVTGSVLDQEIVLRTAAGVTRLTAEIPTDSVALVRLSGIEIVVRGIGNAASFRVNNLLVVRVDGLPALDGVLRQTNGTLFLDDAAGAHAFGRPPAKLLTLVGARVWITGSLETGPTAFGVIVPLR